MRGKSRRTVTTIETHEVWMVRKPEPEPLVIHCAACPHEPAMLTPQQAARQAGVSQRMVYRWVEDGRIHFAENSEGTLFVCLAPLVADV